MVLCEMKECPYNEDNRYCRRKGLSLDERGMCKQIWRKGVLKDDRAFKAVEDEFKVPKDMMRDANIKNTDN